MSGCPTMLLTAVLVYGLAGVAAQAQEFPAKPIRIVTSGAGGGNDFTSRLIAQGITAGLGQPVIVDNRNTVVVPEIVMKAPADGYTLLVLGSPFWVAPLLKKAPYDPIADFAPLSLVGVSPAVLVVNPSLAVKTVRELIEIAKSKPGALNYASTSPGASSHLAAELLKHMNGINLVHVPYKGSAASVNAVLSGEVQVCFIAASNVVAHIASGRLRGLAVTSLKPSALAPGLPTVASAGLPGYEIVAADAMFAPPRTPAPVIRRLNEEINRYLSRPEITERFLQGGVEAVGGPPGNLAARMKADTARLGKLIADAGIQAD